MKIIKVDLSMDDPEFKECWALNNLQPLSKVKNQRKGNRLEM